MKKNLLEVIIFLVVLGLVVYGFSVFADSMKRSAFQTNISTTLASLTHKSVEEGEVIPFSYKKIGTRTPVEKPGFNPKEHSALYIKLANLFDSKLSLGANKIYEVQTADGKVFNLEMRHEQVVTAYKVN